MFIVFADTNVYLDYLLKRAEEQAALNLFNLAIIHEVHIYTSSTCLLQVIYFLKKNGFQNSEIRICIDSILAYTHLADASANIFKMAVAAEFTDLEDAVQYYTALPIKGMDYFITSNIKDYKKASVQLPVLTPKQFIALYYKR